MPDLLSFLRNPATFDGFTLLIPSVSVGNVGQLTVDLIISTYNLQKEATIWHPAIIPVAGSDAFVEDSNDVSTSCELFVNEELKLAAIQLRSSIEIKLALKFFNELKNAIIDLKFKDVIILTSSFAYEMHDINSGHFRFISNKPSDTYSKLNILPMDVSSNGSYLVHGSGYAVKLFDILQECLKTTVLIKYTSEGDNRPDATSMLNMLKACGQFGTKEEPIKSPSSWKYVFGNPPPVGIY